MAKTEFEQLMSVGIYDPNKATTREQNNRPEIIFEH
jgi:hypothetical protein